MKNKSLLLIVTFLSISAWIDLISIMTYVGYELEFSAISVALVSISMLAPQALLNGFIARCVNRFNANHLLIATTIIRALCTLGLIWADTLSTLLPLLLIRSLSIGFFQPLIAGEAQSVSQSQKAQFAALLNLINTLSKVVVPAIGGVFAVYFGEQAVFVLSFGLCCLAILSLLKYPLSRRTPSPGFSAKIPEPQQIPTIFLAGFGSCILLVSGLSLTFSNLLPYTFNFYGVPKSLLSLSLSASAIGAIIYNLAIVRQKLAVVEFPQNHLMAACILSAIAFASLTLTLEFSAQHWLLIPLLFAILSIARAYFETFSNAFIFSCTETVSVTLAAFKQSFAAYSGIAATLLGAASLTTGEPFAFLISISLAALILAIMWGRWDFQKALAPALKLSS
ncbi:hypothetical protein GCM10007094_30110 [Pseudovibrio japonicus]|uniref:MFS transporter n=1 Tax=Pseudovibrio japonicus TaxID=366534 RepID=A0ABQ3EGV3_9HYPH|nr:MFS transporter [Pseudovibrio japonicus]GHB38618.1 hypothetical protein GCM10007094_30110 [Pseudovibrio japonicus]